MADDNRAGREYWAGKGYAFFCNRSCEMFPCHPTADEENFNCLFCYCPLYALGDRCGGNLRFLENGVKDCAHCTLPHERKNYGLILSRFQDIVDLMRENMRDS